MWLLENVVFGVAAYGITDDRIHVIICTCMDVKWVFKSQTRIVLWACS